MLDMSSERTGAATHLNRFRIGAVANEIGKREGGQLGAPFVG